MAFENSGNGGRRRRGEFFRVLGAGVPRVLGDGGGEKFFVPREKGCAGKKGMRTGGCFFDCAACTRDPPGRRELVNTGSWPIG